MSTATYTIDAMHLAPTASPVRTPKVGRAVKTEWTKLRTLPSTWRTAVIATVLSIGLGTILCVSQAQQWTSMTAQQRLTFDPTSCSLFGVVFVGAMMLAALGVRSVTAEYSTGMIRSTFTALPTRRRRVGSQSRRHRGVRIPGGTARRCRQLPGRTARLHRQAPPSVARTSRRSPSGGLRSRRGEPHRRSRGRSRRTHPTHRGRDHSAGARRSSEASRSASCSRPAFVSTCPGPCSRPPSRSTARPDS